MEVLREAPKASAFVPLAEHQSETPASFYSGPPVLHHHSHQSKVIVFTPEIEKALAFGPLIQQHTQLVGNSAGAGAGVDGETTNGDSEQHGETRRVVDNVDIFVTSDKLLLFSSAAGAGVAIPYPTISLHAIQTLPTTSSSSSSSSASSSSNASGQGNNSPGQGVYMQLVTSTDDDEEVDSISVTLVPTASTPSASASASTAPAQTETETVEESAAQALFNALSNCSNLHPDPVNEADEENEDGVGGSRLIQSGLAIPLGASGSGLPPPMPGSGGWITAENMHEFVDADGNFIEQDDDDEEEEEEEGEENGQSAPLGPGAGTVRPRNEAGAEDESKWQRTS